jgi:hypothetical protein
VGILLEKKHENFSAYLNADFRFLSRPGKLERAHLKLEPVPSATVALEWRVWRSVGLLAQLDASANPFDSARNPDLELFTETQLEFSAAILFRLPGRLYGFAGLSEDLIHVSAPDVTFFFGIGTNAFDLLGR